MPAAVRLHHSRLRRSASRPALQIKPPLGLIRLADRNQISLYLHKFSDHQALVGLR